MARVGAVGWTKMQFSSSYQVLAGAGWVQGDSPETWVLPCFPPCTITNHAYMRHCMRYEQTGHSPSGAMVRA
jgi:hypothetical protein